MSFHRIFLTGICIITATTAWADGGQTPTRKQQQWDALDNDKLKRDGERYEHKNKKDYISPLNIRILDMELDCDYENDILYRYVGGDGSLFVRLHGASNIKNTMNALNKLGNDGLLLWMGVTPLSDSGIDAYVNDSMSRYLRVKYRDGTVKCVMETGRVVAATQAVRHDMSTYQENMKWHPYEYITGFKKDSSKLPSCDDGFQALKEDANAESYIYDALIDRDNVAEVINGATDSVCLTYRCKDGYKANLNFKDLDHTEEKKISPKCQQKLTACTVTNGGKGVRDNLVDGEKNTASCLSYDYRNLREDKDAGVLYIQRLIRHMKEQLNANIELAYGVVEAEKKDSNTAKKDSNTAAPFTCEDNKTCTLNENVFSSNKCDFLCSEDDGFLVRLSRPSVNDDPCPAYFEYKYDTKQDMYVCNFDAVAANTKITQMETDAATAAAQQRDRCAQSLCEATGGKMNKSGACMCGEDKCIAEYPSNGHTYYYCGPKKDDHGKNTIYCNPTMGGYWTDTTTEIKNAVSNMNATFKKVCLTSNATSDASTSKTDIPTLVANLSKIESEFGLSKWRTAEGKFNYARLASDATAGIVLGTTGALVTAHVVKKKQVEDGFESLECTVGGQHVGDWGDVFRIDGK